MDFFGARRNGSSGRRKKSRSRVSPSTEDLAACGYFRLEPGNLGQHDVGAECEVAAVPKIVLGDVTSCGLRIGLLHEGFDRTRRPAVEFCARPYVTVTRSRSGRVDAECDDAALGGNSGRFGAGLDEGVGIPQHVVGGEDQHNGGGILRCGERSRDRHRQCGIAAHRLKHDIGLNVAFAQLLSDDEAKIGIGDDDGSAKYLVARDTPDDLLKCRLISDQRNELFGHAFARNRP